MKQALFIINDSIVLQQQESHLPAHFCCDKNNRFIIYIPPTLHNLEEVGVEIKNPESHYEQEALNMLIYSFSHLSLNPSKTEYQSFYSLSTVKKEPSYLEKNSFSLQTQSQVYAESRMMSVAGESSNQIYKPVSVGGSEDDRRKMLENNLKECCII